MGPVRDMSLTQMAEELGDLRARIRQLKQREAELRQAVLAARPNGPVRGRDWVVSVRLSTARRFDKALLPRTVRDDPAYYSTKQTATVLTKPVEGRAAARFDPAADDIVLIEPF